MGVKIEIPKGELIEFCWRNRIRRLSLFGSVRDDCAAALFAPVMG